MQTFNLLLERKFYMEVETDEDNLVELAELDLSLFQESFVLDYEKWPFEKIFDGRIIA